MANDMTQKLEQINTAANQISEHASSIITQYHSQMGTIDTQIPFVGLFASFVLACFVGYYVVWSVTPALHSPLMGVTNAISSVIIVGALIAAGPESKTAASWFGFAAVILASINIFGGFIVTQRMLQMFKKKQR